MADGTAKLYQVCDTKISHSRLKCAAILQETVSKGVFGFLVYGRV